MYEIYTANEELFVVFDSEGKISRVEAHVNHLKSWVPVDLKSLEQKVLSEIKKSVDEALLGLKASRGRKDRLDEDSSSIIRAVAFTNPLLAK